jgi:hypothetical protein
VPRGRPPRRLRVTPRPFPLRPLLNCFQLAARLEGVR